MSAETEAHAEHDAQDVVIDYTNWRGHRRKRRIRPLFGTLRFTETPHHKPAQWVFDAVDMEHVADGVVSPARRTFALAGIHSWEGVPK
jgi:hypothetical protein